MQVIEENSTFYEIVFKKSVFLDLFTAALNLTGLSRCKHSVIPHMQAPQQSARNKLS